MNRNTKEYRESLAQEFIHILKEKQLDWKKTWNGMSETPINAVTNKKYKGINQLNLYITGIKKGYQDSRWCTFLQAKEKGWAVHKGEKGTKIEFWMPYDREQRKCLTWKEFNNLKGDPKRFQHIQFLPKYHTVFNAEQIKDIPPLEFIKKDIKVDEVIKKLEKNMEVSIINDDGDKAYYSPKQDKIYLPKPEYFNDSYSYNATALHELAHATGAEKRLNRNLNNIFGSNEYAFEELIAEISSCFMSQDLQIEEGAVDIGNHKAYVQNWIEAIENKPEILIKAVREAGAVTNYMEYKAELISGKEYSGTVQENFIIKQEEISNAEKQKHDIEKMRARMSKVSKEIDLQR